MAEELNIKLIEGEFQRVAIGEKDVLVLFHPGHLTNDAWGRIRASIHREFPRLKVLLLEEGLKIGAISHADVKSEGVCSVVGLKRKQFFVDIQPGPNCR